MTNRKKPAGLRERATRLRSGELRAKANRAVERFLKSNPAPYGGENWKERDVSTAGYYLYRSGYKQALRDTQRKKGKG